MKKPQIEKKAAVIIIGAGPSGLMAAVYLGREKLNPLILTGDIGGQTAVAGLIENFPGFEQITGLELIAKMQSQAKKWGAEIIPTEPIKSLKKVSPLLFEVEAEDGHKYQASVVLLTSGKQYRKLNISGEDEFTGKGVSFCVTCDGPFYRGKEVAVIGGGNSAVKSIAHLAGIAKKIYSINHNDDLIGEAVMLDRIKEIPHVIFLNSYQTLAFEGQTKLESIKLENLKNKKVEILKVDGVFIEIGSLPNTKYLEGICDLNNKGEVIIDDENRTSFEGLFAAGDVTSVLAKQTVIACGEGAKAAIRISDFLRKKE